MQLTYDDARETILDHTEIGYTVASQDRLWTVFIFDLWSQDALRYNRLYATVSGVWSYDMCGDCLLWTTRREAEATADELRASLRRSHDARPSVERVPEGDPPEVYVINWGDDARYEAAIIGRDSGARCREEPRFAGSRAAWAAMTETYRLWHEANVSATEKELRP